MQSLGELTGNKRWSSDNVIKDLPYLLISALNNLVHGHLGQLIVSWKVIFKHVSDFYTKINHVVQSTSESF